MSVLIYLPVIQFWGWGLGKLCFEIWTFSVLPSTNLSFTKMWLMPVFRKSFSLLLSPTLPLILLHNVKHRLKSREVEFRLRTLYQLFNLQISSNQPKCFPKMHLKILVKPFKTWSQMVIRKSQMALNQSKRTHVILRLNITIKLFVLF